ncbi:hypothetical protein BLNAU_15395 [Blattamonas nauphoetae]|uniref:Uncharacterized protein n=1 Tax=Blattamonas nauphoetae TaxID=2049346 RepID=A0ABQ9XFL0_9EUKA|nr:hypothetical protein BLNAU_15395 [Blattamonas nauphoetae]
MHFDENKQYRRKELPNERFLRGSSVQIGDPSNVDPHPIDEYTDKYRRWDMSGNLSSDERTQLGNKLRATNYNLGDGRGNYETQYGQAFQKPRAGEQEKATVNTAELQRSHIVLGDGQPGRVDGAYATTTRSTYDKKDLPLPNADKQEMINQLRREHWAIGDPSSKVTGRDFATTHQDTFKAPDGPVDRSLPQATMDDLRKSHIVLAGGEANSQDRPGGHGGVVTRAYRQANPNAPQANIDDGPYTSTTRAAYVKHDPTKTRGLANAGQVSGILPSEITPQTKQLLRAHHYELGDGRGVYGTSYNDNYVPQQMDPEVWEKVDDENYRRRQLPNERFLRGSSIQIGDPSNVDAHPIDEYRDRYRKWDPADLQGANERKEIEARLRQTNYTLGDGRGDYDTNYNVAYVKPRPGEQEQATVNTAELQRSHIVLQDTNPDNYAQALADGFKTTTRSTYNKKDLPPPQLDKQEMINQLRREHWAIGDPSSQVTGRDYATTFNTAFTKPENPQKTELPESTKADLRRSHVVFGGSEASSADKPGGEGGVMTRAYRQAHPEANPQPTGPGTYSTTMKSSYTKPDQTRTRGLPNAGQVSGILPTEITPETKQILRAHHYDLGDGRGEWDTTYRVNYIPQPLDPDQWEEVGN